MSSNFEPMFEDCFGNLDHEKVFYSMNKHLCFDVMLQDENIHVLAKCVYEDFYKDKYDYYLKYHTKFVEKVRENIYPKKMYSQFNILKNIVFYMHEQILPKFTFFDFSIFFNVLKTDGIQINRDMPLVWYKCIFDLLESDILYKFMIKVNMYYKAYYSFKDKVTRHKFCNFMQMNFCGPTSQYFQHQVNHYIDMYNARKKIARAYKAYRMRVRLPVVANKSRIMDMIRYRPGTGVEYFKAKDFFDNKRFLEEL
jgi:hypothetical protein